MSCNPVAGVCGVRYGDRCLNACATELEEVMLMCEGSTTRPGTKWVFFCFFLTTLTASWGL